MREKVITIFLLGFILLVASSMFHMPMQYNINGPQNLAIPSQATAPISVVGNIELSQRSTGGVGTRSDPYLIARRSIISAGDYCISIQNTTAFFAIRDCKLEVTIPGVPNIYFNNVENGLIENCYLRGGSGGAYLSFCTDCIITESTFVDCSNGISIRNSENCTILDCSAYINEVGVRISISNGSIVTNSSIYSNYNRGVSIDDFSYGTTIYQNSIGWNGLNAYNDGDNTLFTNGISIGNAWSDYNGTGVYVVSGSNPSTDLFATTLTDTESPIIDSPLDKIYDVETNGETLTWVASDDFAFSYLLSIDGVQQGTEPWIGREITISLDTLPVGTHTFLMTVRDASGNNAEDEVVVTAVSFVLGGIGTELVMWGSALTVAVFILVIIIIKKMP